MSYKVTVIADFNGRIYLGADKRPLALETASPIAEVKLYSSQIPFAVSAKAPDGKVIITTKRKAKKNGWVILRDHENKIINDIGPEESETAFSYSSLLRVRQEAMADGIEYCAKQLPDSLRLIKQGWMREANKLRR